MADVTILAEVTGDNANVTPDQLLDIVRKDLRAPDVRGPVTRLLIYAVRGDEEGLDTYRANLPLLNELALVARVNFLTFVKDFNKSL